MIRVALRGLAGRKLRAFLTALAIVLGVAMVSGTFVLTDAIDSAFNEHLHASRTRARTRSSAGSHRTFNFEGDTSQAPSVPASPPAEGAQAAGRRGRGRDRRRRDGAKIINRKGKAITTGGAPSFGFGVDYSEPQFNPLQADRRAAGRAAPNEVVIDSGDRRATSTSRSATRSASRRWSRCGRSSSSGSRSTATSSSLGSATFAIFTIPTAQKLFDREGQLDAISVAAKPGVSQEQLVERDPAASCRDKVTVRTARSRRRRTEAVGLVHEVHPLLPALVRRDRALRRARSSSSTRSRSRSRSGSASSRRCGRSAPRAGSSRPP